MLLVVSESSLKAQHPLGMLLEAIIKIKKEIHCASYFEIQKRKWNHSALCTLDMCVSSSLSSPSSNHLLRGRVDVLCASLCLRGAGQDGRHAFRDALFHGVSSPPVSPPPPPPPVFTGGSPSRARTSSTINRHFLHLHQSGCASGVRLYFCRGCQLNGLFCKRSLIWEYLEFN